MSQVQDIVLCFRTMLKLVLFCLQGRSPVNFPDYPYDTQDICSPADVAEFVQLSREKAARLTKSRQSSRLTLACHNFHVTPKMLLLFWSSPVRVLHLLVPMSTCTTSSEHSRSKAGL